MLFFATAIFLGLLAFFIWLGISNASLSNGDKLGYGVGGVITGATYVLIMVVVTLVMSIHVVDNRNVGVVKTFGSITGQVGEGIQFTMPWQSVEEWNIRLQVIEPEGKCDNGSLKCMEAGSIDSQAIYINAALNMDVDVRDVQNLARNIGPNYTNIIVRNRMDQVVKRVISQYPATDILAKREEIRDKIRSGLADELTPYSINVSDFLLTNIDFTDSFRASIDAKQKATQDALTAENVVKIKEAEARQAVASAQGAADARRIAAQGEADANNLINASLNGNILQYRIAGMLGDKVQFVPSGSGLILDPATLLAPKK